MTPRLYIARTPDGAGFPLPSYESQYHAGLRLLAAIGAPIKINPEERLFVPVGFSVGVPQGFCGQIVSSAALAEQHGIIVSDAPHILNPADRGPLFVLLQNISKNPYVLHRGDMIAELIIMPVVQVCWHEVMSKVSAHQTPEDQMIVENPKQPQEEGLFNSLRRKKIDPRHKFGMSEDDS